MHISFRYKVWLLRATGVVPLLLLPLVCSLPGLAVFHETRGDSIPFFGLLGIIVGLLVDCFVAKRIFVIPDLVRLRAAFFLVVYLILFEGAVITLVKIFTLSGW